MVYYPRGLDLTFGALSDPTRREIVTRLARREETISALATRFDMTLPAVSKHVRVLERAGLVRVRRIGRSRHTTLVARPMQDAVSWINRHRALWEHQFDRLALYLESTSPESPSWPPLAPTSRSKSAAHSTPRASASSRRGRARRS